jgi:hypothetical protein
MYMYNVYIQIHIHILTYTHINTYRSAIVEGERIEIERRGNVVFSIGQNDHFM